MTALQAIERSSEYGDIVTISGSPEVHSYLRAECDDSVEHYVDADGGYTLTEYWAGTAYGTSWRVHVRDRS